MTRETHISIRTCSSWKKIGVLILVWLVTYVLVHVRCKSTVQRQSLHRAFNFSFSFKFLLFCFVFLNNNFFSTQHAMIKFSTVIFISRHCNDNQSDRAASSENSHDHNLLNIGPWIQKDADRTGLLVKMNKTNTVPSAEPTSFITTRWIVL